MNQTFQQVEEFFEELVSKNNPNRVEMLIQAYRQNSPNYSSILPMLRTDDINLLLHSIEAYKVEKGTQQNLKFLRKIKSNLKKQKRIVEEMQQSEVLQQVQNQVSCINQYYFCNQIIAVIAAIADILSIAALVVNLDFQSVDESGNTTINALAIFNVIMLIVLFFGIIGIIVRQYLQQKETTAPLSRHVSEALSLTNSILQEYHTENASAAPSKLDQRPMVLQERSQEVIKVQPT